MRYLPQSDKSRQEMLKEIGISNQRDFFSSLEVPHFSDDKMTTLGQGKSELDVERILYRLSAQNKSAHDYSCFMGGGAYYHHIPAAVDAIIQRGEFMTSYTPYQPEISQGTLQYLYEFQTQICVLTGMEIANASMYEGASATAEAVMMANRITKKNKAILSGGLHPHYAQVVQTHGHLFGFEILTQKPDLHNQEDLTSLLTDDISCVVIQCPSFFGHIRDFTSFSQRCHEKNILVIMVFTEVVALGLVKPFGEMGADIVVGEGQSLGVSLGFGGPYLGLMATKEKYLRQMPGRLCGQTVDIEGRRSFVLTLVAREQHIRREKATSNICTNSGLCALAFCVHLSLLGQTGLQKLAKLNHYKAQLLANELQKIPQLQIVNSSYFNEFVVQLPEEVDLKSLQKSLLSKNILAGILISDLFPNQQKLSNYLLLCATEMVSQEEIIHFTNTLHTYLKENRYAA